MVKLSISRAYDFTVSIGFAIHDPAGVNGAKFIDVLGMSRPLQTGIIAKSLIKLLNSGGVLIKQEQLY